MHLAIIDFKALRKLRLNEETNDQEFKFNQPLKLKKINLFIGANGGGKSTIIDLVRSISEPAIITSLPRENMRANTGSGFMLVFSDGTLLSCRINKLSIMNFGIALRLKMSQLSFSFNGILTDRALGTLPEKISEIYQILPATVAYRSHHDERGVDLEYLVKMLNRHGRDLEGLLPTPLMKEQFSYSAPSFRVLPYLEENPIEIEDRQRNLLSVWFNDDRLQSNRVSLEMLPSGWRAYAGLLAWLEMQPPGAICVIEEPETHLHPRLLRKLINNIVAIATAGDLQLFITTHSGVFIDLNIWPHPEVSLFEVDSYEIRELTNPARVLANLGIKPADINQANGLLWLEGPSDRIYMLHWLRLWCEETAAIVYRENIHFAVMLYGGAVLNHFSANLDEEAINILKINQNVMVLIDRDLDFVRQQGTWVAKNPHATKNRIYTSVPCFITEGYTIESYLPKPFFNRYFAYVNGRVVNQSSLSKVDIARIYCQEYTSYQACFTGAAIKELVAFCYNQIKTWNA